MDKEIYKTFDRKKGVSGRFGGGGNGVRGVGLVGGENGLVEKGVRGVVLVGVENGVRGVGLGGVEKGVGGMISLVRVMVLLVFAFLVLSLSGVSAELNYDYIFLKGGLLENVYKYQST